MAGQNASTQEFVAIKDIRDNIVVQSNGQLSMVLLASSINFALKSLEEQQAILLQFQNFLNTLDFSLQIYIQSRRLNIQPYLGVLQNMESEQANDLMRIQLREYIEFIDTFTTEVDVMSKSFFVLVPFSPTALNLSKGVGGLLGGKSGSSSGEGRFEEHRVQLEQRVSLVTEGLARLGVRTITLQKDELVEFFYHIYNPGDRTGSAPALQT